MKRVKSRRATASVEVPIAPVKVTFDKKITLMAPVTSTPDNKECFGMITMSVDFGPLIQAVRWQERNEVFRIALIEYLEKNWDSKIVEYKDQPEGHKKYRTRTKSLKVVAPRFQDSKIRVVSAQENTNKSGTYNVNFYISKI